MCGFITAVSKKEQPFSQDILKKMNSLIHHRGPDDEGYFQYENWLSMAFKRLSILDLTDSGHQPMVSRDNRYAVTFNGEIYNYLEIREELVKDGYQFFSETDTEVLLNAYRKWGKDCLGHFNGMFAFVIVDLKEKHLFAARDPLGIKPLFYFEDNNFFLFTSEIKTLLPYTSFELNENCINEYLVFRFVIGHETLFKNVKNLPPGHCLELTGGKLVEKEYFRITELLNPDYSISFDDNCKLVEEQLAESIKIHLRSDVELGVQLSGGVDSSLITALAADQTGKKFHTFSISFAESAFDESKYQKMVSKKYNTVHHDYPMDNPKFTELFPETIWHYEHPLNDPNAVATHYLTKRAKEYITVMLSGEGADESFLGYTRFNFDSIERLKKRNWLYKHPQIREFLYNFWPIRKGKSLYNITRYCPAMYVLSYADLNLIHELLQGNDKKMKFRHETIDWAEGNVLNEAIIQDQVCDLMQWFWRADRMGMAASMELRVPFCTVPMFKIANSIPHEQRIYQGERKAVLKKIAEKYLDKEQIYRKKIGFGTPIDNWINQPGAYLDLYTEIMESDKFRKRPFINAKHFESIYNAHKNGTYRENNSAFLWTYFSFEMWYRIFFENEWRKFASF